ncbi:SYG1 [[Candida] subhashii]|uniref:SYG1 n=1 Tax=[Candida] subhashii TaxID=561895 RepID=A0A8J5QGH7_9ASCO|nr:SYG1 [[Candida] subhashii]KAG7660761.1 SYG1 [[Candida] subhashii]
MKFAESLSEGLVPEWQDQYVDYKQGKKLIKSLLAYREQENAIRRPSEGNLDTTPLLEAQTESENNTGQPHTQYVTDEIPPSISRGDSSQSSRWSQLPRARRPSIFTSMRSFSLKRDDKENDSDEDAMEGTEEDKFNKWLDQEVKKVNKFFIEKEQDIYERFLLLQDQLYQLRDHKLHIIKEKSLPSLASSPTSDHPKNVLLSERVANIQTRFALAGIGQFEFPSLPSMTFWHKLTQKNKQKSNSSIALHRQKEPTDINYLENRIRNGVIDLSPYSGAEDQLSSATESEEDLGIPSRSPPPQTEEQLRTTQRRDYTVKKHHFGVPYLHARRQLKDALLEHYRALALLRAYKTLNRTAFRKITKKFDKAMKNTNVMTQFLNKIDNEEYFLTSDLVDKLISHVEELYLAFFDPSSTDRKHSLEKLKSIAYALNASEMRPKQYYTEFFFSGWFIGFGIPLFTFALYIALSKTINGLLPEGRYLLQIWAGFFLLNLAFLLFGINMIIFDRCKINYKFIFEFDMATVLNYRQYWVLPSFGFMLLSLIGWFSFNNFWPNQFDGRDWPWIYLATMVIIFIWPGKQFYHHSRKWLQIALWRILFSGFYPVEFRDFFLGDIICSLTYTMGNLSFYFCLYSHHWNGSLSDNLGMHNVCGSSKSRLMGFFSTLPSIWRFLQCLRRYMDTGDWFPHLANMAKYCLSATYYITLSIYRIDRIRENKWVFICFAMMNSIYCSIWDILMDWSLMQPHSKNYLLRDHLFYKKPGFYYTAMIVDVILRFQWVFYAFFNNQIQQSQVTSFGIAFAEIIRRFIWIFFRMENEHCTNVTLFRASKDTPLPYAISYKVEKAIKQLVELKYRKYADSTLFEDTQVDYEPVTGTVPEQEYQYEEPETIPYRPTHATGRQHHLDEEQSIDSSLAELPRLQRRKSAFQALSEHIPHAHIKDFQRRRTYVGVDEDSDEDEYDDDSLHPHPSNRRNPSDGELSMVSE